MKGAVELARTAIREFDLHIRNAWKRELGRLEHDGDAVGLVLMQECSPDIENGWHDCERLFQPEPQGGVRQYAEATCRKVCWMS